MALTLKEEYRGMAVERVPYRGGHRYKVTGHDELYVGASTIAGILDKSTPLMKWARETAVDKVRQELLGIPPIELPDEQGRWENFVMDMCATAEMEETEARDLGSITHRMIEAQLKGERPPEWIDEATIEELQPGVDAALAWIHSPNPSVGKSPKPLRGPLTIRALEYSMWHPHMNYGGTIDLEAVDMDEMPLIADWKRSKHIYHEHGYQMSAYMANHDAIHEGPMPRGFVIRLPREKGGEIEVEEIDLYKGFMVFLAAHEAYKARSRHGQPFLRPG